MIVNPVYGAGGATAPQITIGGSFGAPLGDTSGNITVTTSGHVGETALFVVMHRADITVDSSWDFIDKRTTVYDSTSEQHISIYKKTIETSAETYTITSTTARMYCTMYYSNKDIDVVYQQTKKMEKQRIGANDYAVAYIEPADKILAVYNAPYALSGNNMEILIANRTIIPQDNRNPVSGFPNSRMISFFTADKTEIVVYPWRSDDTDEYTDVFIYVIA